MRCRGFRRLVRKASLIVAAVAILARVGATQDSAPARKIERPGVKEFQVPFTSLKPEVTFKIGEDADWVQITDPVTNRARQTISIAPGSYNPLFDERTSGDGVIWITGGIANILTAVDASSGAVLATFPVGPKPRFLAAGDDSVWTLNQGDGSVSRIDAQSRKVTATITVGIPGPGGDIAWGAGSVWTTVFGVPLTAIDGRTNKVRRQWIGPGGDALRFGHGSIWLTDNKHGTLSRISLSETSR
jgi:YVTN family beta-propeller protein